MVGSTHPGIHILRLTSPVGIPYRLVQVMGPSPKFVVLLLTHIECFTLVNSYVVSSVLYKGFLYRSRHP